MINELCQLADSLEMENIITKYWQADFGTLAQGVCYKISLGENGNIGLIDEIPKLLHSKLRKWEPSGNGFSFPGCNIPPLYRIVDNDKKKQLQKWREGKSLIDINILKDWCTPYNNNWNNEKKLKKCLSDIPQDMQKIFGNIPAEFNALSVLFKRLAIYKWDTDGEMKQYSFREKIESYLWEQLQKGIAIPTILSLLVYEGNLKIKPEKDRGKASVFFEVENYYDHGAYPVAHEKTISWMNEKLIEWEDKNISTIEEKDAFDNALSGKERKLPVIDLPRLGDVFLRAMSSESPCQYRYGTVDAISYPVGQESRKRAKGALEWLRDPSREGETWGRADTRELLFAYPSILPEVSIKLASCFGARKVDDMESRFSDAAKNAIAGLSGISKDLHNLELRVFSLKKMDTARTKIVFHRNYSAQRLMEAAKDWQIGSNNIPRINIRVWGEKKGEIVSANIETPFPLQIAPCLNQIWKLDGTTEYETPIIHRSQGIELLLDEHPIRLIPHLLSVAIQNGKGVLISMGSDLSQGNVITIKKRNDNYKLLIPSILGLLLHKHGIRKEIYMSNAPFLVGRMLKLADELHALYCKEVRDNNLPPQLIGNTLMTTALECPIQSLAQLALRLKPYYGWAQTYRSKENGGLAGYFITLYGEISAELANLNLPSRFNDAERAQFLLGYLAANPKKADKATETITIENSITKGA